MDRALANKKIYFVINNVVITFASMARNSTLYNTVLSTIDNMEIGDSRILAIPGQLKAFRKYLTEISQRQGKKFTTKVQNNKLVILRIKYSNIYSKEVE